MPSNFLILLVIISGYLFNHSSHKLRFRAQTLAGHRLILEAAVSGLVFLAGARALAWGLREFILPQELLSWWWSFSGGLQFAGASVIALILAPVFAFGANLCVGCRQRDLIPVDNDARWWWNGPDRWRRASRQYYHGEAIRKSGNPFQKLLHQAATHAEDGLTIGVTMTNGKIYVAQVIASPNLSPADEYVSVLPLLSGHRDADTLKIVYDTLYPVPKFQQLAAMHEVAVALPVPEIKSAHMLDEEYYAAEIKRLSKAEED